MVLAVLTMLVAAGAQQSGKVYRVGILTDHSPLSSTIGPEPSGPVRALRQRLRELGYVYGQNLVTEPRSAEGVPDRLPGLAAELVRLKVDVIVTSGGTARAAKSATNTIPIVIGGLGGAAAYTRAWLEALGDVRPTSTLLGIPALVHPEMLIEIEAEAIIGASRSRRDIFTEQQREKPRGYARAVQVGDWIWVSGCTSMNSAGQPQAPGDWAAQSDHAHETIRWALEQAGAVLDDVVAAAHWAPGTSL